MFNLQKLKDYFNSSNFWKVSLGIVLILIAVALFFSLIGFLSSFFFSSNFSYKYGLLLPQKQGQFDYRISLEVNDKDAFLSELKKFNYLKVKNLREDRNQAFLVLEVNKAYLDDFMDFLNKYKVLSLEINKKDGNLTEVNRQISELEKRKNELLKELNEIEKNYNYLIEIAKKKGDVRALNEIYSGLFNQKDKIEKEINDLNLKIEKLREEKEKIEKERNYCTVYLAVYENKIIDFDSIKESWENAFKNLINNINVSLQKVTIGLINFIVNLIVYVVYGLIA